MEKMNWFWCWNGGSEPAAPISTHHEGWMVSDEETVFCWVSVP
jgi:hypothetical protein